MKAWRNKRHNIVNLFCEVMISAAKSAPYIDYTALRKVIQPYRIRFGHRSRRLTPLIEIFNVPA